VLLAFDQVKKRLSETQALAKQYNRTEAQSLLLNEHFTLDSLNFGDLKALLQDVKIVTGPTTTMPGVRVRLGQDVTYRDYPRGAVVVLPRQEAEYLTRKSPPCAVVVD
jgi:hypothetical protein